MSPLQLPDHSILFLLSQQLIERLDLRRSVSVRQVRPGYRLFDGCDTNRVRWHSQRAGTATGGSDTGVVSDEALPVPVTAAA